MQELSEPEAPKLQKKLSISKSRKSMRSWEKRNENRNVLNSWRFWWWNGFAYAGVVVDQSPPKKIRAIIKKRENWLLQLHDKTCGQEPSTTKNTQSTRTTNRRRNVSVSWLYWTCSSKCYVQQNEPHRGRLHSSRTQKQKHTCHTWFMNYAFRRWRLKYVSNCFPEEP